MFFTPTDNPLQLALDQLTETLEGELGLQVHKIIEEHHGDGAFAIVNWAGRERNNAARISVDIFGAPKDQGDGDVVTVGLEQAVVNLVEGTENSLIYIASSPMSIVEGYRHISVVAAFPPVH